MKHSLERPSASSSSVFSSGYFLQAHHPAQTATARHSPSPTAPQTRLDDSVTERALDVWSSAAAISVSQEHVVHAPAAPCGRWELTGGHRQHQGAPAGGQDRGWKQRYGAQGQGLRLGSKEYGNEGSFRAHVQESSWEVQGLLGSTRTEGECIPMLFVQCLCIHLYFVDWTLCNWLLLS